jgi:hypothetical protein
MDDMARSTVGLFTAKLIGPDGFMEGRFFSTEKAAREWLMGAGLRSFEGDVKKAELCSPGDRLIWSKLRPKSGNRRRLPGTLPSAGLADPMQEQKPGRRAKSLQIES